MSRFTDWIFNNIKLKFFLLLLFISTAVSTQKFTKSEEDQLKSTALTDVANELFTRHEIRFEIFIYKVNFFFENVSTHVYDVINGLRHGQFYTTILKADFNRFDFPHLHLSGSAIIFCESIEKIRELLDVIVGDTFFPRNLKFLFYVEKPFNVTQIGVLKINAIFMSRFSWFAYFIFKHESRFRNSKDIF